MSRIYKIYTETVFVCVCVCVCVGWGGPLCVHVCVLKFQLLYPDLI